MPGNGNTFPHGYRSATMSSRPSDGKRPCLLDLPSSEAGSVDPWREAGVSQQWCSRCDDFTP